MAIVTEERTHRTGRADRTDGMDASRPRKTAETLIIDGIPVALEGERNVLELVRKADIDLPTFCYHSELSVYGACRLCLVDVEGRGIQAACSTPPEPGMRIRTQTAEIREIRRISIELLLANHDQSCPTCPRSATCKLLELARRLGVQKVRFKPVHEWTALDASSPSLVRDPNKCVLCGDCVRSCDEIQSVGAIDFAHRGHRAAVMPAFGSPLGESECVNCGQCAAVCPTGALAPKSEVDDVWKALHDRGKVVVAQIAPAVRVAIGECFGLPAGTISTGQVVSALRRLGFDRVYDTAFAADLTVVEEANEFLHRLANEENLPQFTSCCPAWVKFAEQYFPDLLGRLSTCRSPQAMMGSICKDILPQELGVERERVVMVSIMPCTAKKFEARRPELANSSGPDVDHVLTTQELARMIEEAGIPFARLEPSSFDMPMGYKTGAGLIFGNSGGVAEAVLRYAAEIMTGGRFDQTDFHEVRGDEGLRFASLRIGDTELKLGVVAGLAHARRLAEQVRAGEMDLDLVEVMACPGGCVGGAGQPVAPVSTQQLRRMRTGGLYAADKTADLHRSQENHFVQACYDRHLGEVGGHRAHALLHTRFSPRRRVADQEIVLGQAAPSGKSAVRCSVCVGTNCFAKGSQRVLQTLASHVDDANLHDRVQLSASFCFERCEHGPNVSVGGRLLENATPEAARVELEHRLHGPGHATSQS